MKKHLLAIAALAAISGSVAAQSVTVYGTMDAGIQSSTKANAAGDSQIKMLTGGLAATVWGLKGTEDLGGGMKANFQLEGYFTNNDGAGQIFGGLFGRMANVSLSSSAGEIKLGKQLDPHFLVGFAATDPRGAKETNSGLITWLTGNHVNVATPTSGTQSVGSDGTTTAGHNTTSLSNIFLGNAVAYYGSFNGLNVGVGYALGGVAGDSSQNSTTSVGANYSVAGLTIAGGFSEDNGNVDTNTSKQQAKRWSIGAGYQVTSDIKLKANYMEAKQNNTSGVEYVKNEVFGVGVEYKPNAKNLVSVAYYDGENKLRTNDTSKTWLVSNEYSLSKRTTLYGLVAGNKGGSGFQYASSMLNTLANQTNTVFQLGVAHRF
jgi:predicted porin